MEQRADGEAFFDDGLFGSRALEIWWPVWQWQENFGPTMSDLVLGRRRFVINNCWHLTVQRGGILVRSDLEKRGAFAQ
jgi:hypothetical protein